MTVIVHEEHNEGSREFLTKVILHMVAALCILSSSDVTRQVVPVRVLLPRVVGCGFSRPGKSPSIT
jgi:hypothetical protein